MILLLRICVRQDNARSGVRAVRTDIQFAHDLETAATGVVGPNGLLVFAIRSGTAGINHRAGFGDETSDGDVRRDDALATLTTKHFLSKSFDSALAEGARVC